MANRHVPAASIALTAVLLATTASALAATRLGTQNPETLVGTHGPDQITGGGGGDTLKGLAGDDLYYFDDGYGYDTLVERASYRVGGKKIPGGVDTLSFLATNGDLYVQLIPEWGSGNNYAFNSGGRVDLGTSRVENVILGGGGPGTFNMVEGGVGKNTLQPGGGAEDWLRDYGGWKDGAKGWPGLPASNDVFKGFARNTGSDFVYDWGGTDVVDLRPFSTADVFIGRFNADPSYSPPGTSGGNTTEESLQIVTGDTSQVVLVGHFGEYWDFTTNSGQQGRIETIIFADTTLSGPTAQALGTAVAGSAAPAGTSARLAKAADRLADQARRELANAPEPGAPPKHAQPPDKPRDGANRHQDTRLTADTGASPERSATADRGSQNERRAEASRRRRDRRHHLAADREDES